MTTATTTFEQVLAEALNLAPEDQEQLLNYLAANQPIRPRKSLAELAAEQGKHPVSFDELLELGEFLPAEESVDDLLAFVRQSRTDNQTMN